MSQPVEAITYDASASKGAREQLNPRSKHYEFGGPAGTAFVTLTVPLTAYSLYFACSEQSGGCPPGLRSLFVRALDAAVDPVWWASLWDTQAALLYVGWYAFCIAAWAIIPGEWVTGTPLRGDRGVQRYKINAFATFLAALGITGGYIFRNGASSFTFLYDKWLGFMTAAFVMSVAQSAYCYASSFGDNKLLALGGNTGNFIHDFFIGRELNPSIGSLDIKSFNELRPGLILWVLIDISMACEQAMRLGGRVTDSMWLVLAFQGWYVADALYNEPAILTTMDITTDGFGYMLAAGDLFWVPFTYSLQARYLAFRPVELGPIRTAAVLAVNLLGYYIFRDSNGEKNDFRNGKNPKNLKFFTTSGGSKLLISGWWGLSRHPNYFGDLLMALAWSLPTGFSTPITYFYVTYFAVLLVHRQRRDDENCEKKYGQDWKKYMEYVPYRIIPYVY